MSQSERANRIASERDPENRFALMQHNAERVARDRQMIPPLLSGYDYAMRNSPGYKQARDMEKAAVDMRPGDPRIKKASARAGLPQAIANIAQQRNLGEFDNDVERAEDIRNPMARRSGRMDNREPGQNVQFRKNLGGSWVANRNNPMQAEQNLGATSAPDSIREGNDPRQRYLQHKERMGLIAPTNNPETIRERREKMGLEGGYDIPARPRPRNIQEGRQALNKDIIPDVGGGLPTYAANLYNSRLGAPGRRNKEAVGYRDNLLANGSMDGELPGYEKQPYNYNQTPPAELGRFKQSPRPEGVQPGPLANAIGNMQQNPERNTRYDYIPPRLRDPREGTDLLDIEPDEEE
jgi:hypothetical protein